MFSLCHPWFTTTNLSYTFPIFETSATASCGSTGIYKSNETLRYWCRTCATPRGPPHTSRLPLHRLWNRPILRPRQWLARQLWRFCMVRPDLWLCGFALSSNHSLFGSAQVYFTEATVYERWLATVGGESTDPFRYARAIENLFQDEAEDERARGRLSTVKI